MRNRFRLMKTSTDEQVQEYKESIKQYLASVRSLEESKETLTAQVTDLES